MLHDCFGDVSGHLICSLVGDRLCPLMRFALGAIELAEKIKKEQFKTGKLGGRRATLPEIWRAALSA